MPKTIDLTPTILRALGEGVASLKKGDGRDLETAEKVIEDMGAKGYTYSFYSFHPKSAKQLAREILDVAEGCLAGQISLEEQGQRNKALWDLARDLGLYSEVDAILQALSEQEMKEALSNLVER